MIDTTHHSKLLSYLATDTSLHSSAILATLTLLDEGATIPFIARYRKERTFGLDETQLRLIQIKYEFYTTLFTRQKSILKSMTEQGALTAHLKEKIEATRDKQSLEDLYLPYKKGRKTKADIAIEKGYEPLAKQLLSQTLTERPSKEALEGACHIVAQKISDNAAYRQYIRKEMLSYGQLKTKVTRKFKAEKTKFDMYYDFTERLSHAASHRVLAIRRGEKEKIINWKIIVDEARMLSFLERHIIKNKNFSLLQVLQYTIKEAYTKSLSPSIQKECFTLKVDEAEVASISVFAKNFEKLLLAPPVGAKVIMGIDPGFRTGCKIAIVDKTGVYKDTATIFPVPPVQKMAEAERIVLAFLSKYKVDLIAIGNGTGSKETMVFIKALIKKESLTVIPVIVNEAGASVYSASELAIEEYPQLDVTVRGAISIAHRLQDPLAEFVKIDPKAIGVGQYQHDVNQGALKKSLSFSTETVVNKIGVDLNTASASLLTYISGIGPTLAQNILRYRHQNGSFKTRKALLKVPKLGAKAFEQCAGFLRIKEGGDPLDNTAIHPESYNLATKISSNTRELSHYVTDTVGLPTLQHIADELLKPSVDPRAEFSYANFDDEVDDIADLKEGMSLEGVVTNVTNFGAFVDIGVHQDGLIHISKLSNTFVKDPHDIVSVGDTVKVTVMTVDAQMKRISLAMNLDDS